MSQPLTDEERAALDPVERAHLNMYGYLAKDAPPPSRLSAHARQLDADLRAMGFPGLPVSDPNIGLSPTEAAKKAARLSAEAMRTSSVVSVAIEASDAPADAPVIEPSVTLPLNAQSFTREWHGESHVATVLTDGGFAYRGQRFTSLSAVACHITGCSTSGPAFFRTRVPGVARQAKV